MRVSSTLTSMAAPDSESALGLDLDYDDKKRRYSREGSSSLPSFPSSRVKSTGLRMERLAGYVAMVCGTIRPIHSTVRPRFGATAKRGANLGYQGFFGMPPLVDPTLLSIDSLETPVRLWGDTVGYMRCEGYEPGGIVL
eukprot:scaffold546_cov163-Amphora_coffeaeformis.AAC.11